MFELSKDQDKALNQMLDFYASKNKDRDFLTLGGYAGTGKTTLISELRKEIDTINPKAKIAFCAFTGKAVQVLKNKLVQNQAIYKKDEISTIHSLIYRTIEDERGAVLGWIKKELEEVDFDLIIVDEASMVDEKIWNDLKYYAIPIIAVGDHGQLPPISGNFNLMNTPEIKLETIHRQAEGNPIIQVSILARERGKIPHQKWDKNVFKVPTYEGHEYFEDLFSSYNSETLVLCNFNNTRLRLNQSIRNHLGFEGANPQKNDRVICLRNNHEKQIFNGMQGYIKYIKPKNELSYDVEIEMDGSSKLYTGLISKDQFNSETTLNNINKSYKTQGLDLFDFGYALTVHKSQGSQAKKVILFEERNKHQSDDDFRRWLYTAVTRAEEKLIIFGN
jgi:exodeoxyribonuclease-5